MLNVEISSWSQAPPDEESGPDVLPLVASAYERCGYEAGYSRGVNDVLAMMLESAAAFSRIRPGSAKETLSILHAFSEFLEQKLERTSNAQHQTFGDGSGI